MLRRQGERHFTGDLQDISSNRRLAILATCVVEWAATIADTVVETHDRIVGKTWREAKKISAMHFEQAQADIASTLVGFQSLGTTLLMARGDEAALGRCRRCIQRVGWFGNSCGDGDPVDQTCHG